ncbi:MAG: ABC transporter substrate-binding protein, partial [Alphaproteobacteria bacterium]|nr:ABC transporter substrate-binding protein [Alphaproteobacteria bacterium]
MSRFSMGLSGTALAVALGASVGFAAGTAGAADTVVMAVPSFLTGAGAPAFGVPSRNGAELMINAINKGKVPAPYNSKGLAGRQIEAIFYDESGGSTKQVAEVRNKVQKQGADLFVGFISSGTCAAIAPVVEELKVMTILPVCGTPRIFEDIIPNARYTFRTMMHATADGVAEAHWVKAKMPDVKSYTGLNQNYAWGQDSWRDFDLAMKTLMPQTTASDKPQWPKIFAGQYGAEISALMLSKQNLIHSSFWGGDLEAFIFQGSARGMFKKKTLLFSVAASSVYRLGKKFPDGVILGARGPYGIYGGSIDTPINNWFRAAYLDRYNTPPTGGAYQFAQGVLAAKYAYDKAAAANGGKFPSQDQVLDALTGATFEGIATTVKLAVGNGHQAVTDYMLGRLKWDKEKGE